MEPNPPLVASADLHRRREQILRGFARVNYAAIVVVMVVIGLALAAAAAAFRSARNARSAQIASQQAQNELWNARLAQARAERFSGKVGRRTEGLLAVAAAAKIRPSPALRNEAIGLLALTDLDEQKVFWPHPSNLDEGSLDFDPDVRRYCWGDAHGVCFVKQMDDNREVARLAGPSSRVVTTRFSPDGAVLAVRHANGELRLWNIANQKVQFATNCPVRQNSWEMNFSPDGKFIGVVDLGLSVIRLFEPVSGRELSRIKSEDVGHIAFNPTRPELAIGDHGTLILAEIPSGQIKTRSEPGIVQGLFNWSPNGRYLAMGMSGGNIMLWDTQGHRTNILEGHISFISDLCFDPSGELLASRSWDGLTRLWDVATAKQLLVTSRGYAMRFSRDGERLAVLKERSGVSWWRVLRPRIYKTLDAGRGPGEDLYELFFTKNGRWAAVNGSQGIHLLDLLHPGEMETISEIHEPVRTVVIDNVSNAIVQARSDGIFRWRFNPAAENIHSLLISRQAETVRPLHAEEVTGFSVTPGSGRLIYSMDQTRLEWEEADKKAVVRASEDQPGVHSVDLSPDGRWAASGTRHGRGPRLWNARTGALIRQLDSRDSNVRFSPDGRWLATGFGYEVVFRDTDSWQPRPGMPRDITSGVACDVEFSADSKWVAMPRTEDLISLVDVQSNQVLADLASPMPRNLNGYRFSPDNRHLSVTTSEVAQLWDLQELRRQLAEYGLDWGKSDRPLASVLPGTLDQPRGSVWLAWASAIGVLLALAFAILIYQRNRQWPRDYSEVEAMVARHNSDLALAQQELLQSQKMKALGTLAAGLAHDFNNLLSVIRMANKSIARATTPEMGLNEDTRDIEEAVLEGKGIVRSMLGSSREMAGPPELYKPLDVASETVALLSKQFLAGLELTVDFEPASLNVITRGSRVRLQQIVLNLLVNAAEAMGGHGKLHLSARRESMSSEEQWVLRPAEAQHYLELRIRDTGPGIAPESVNRIFEPFFTTKTSGSARGTGLGLYLVYALAQAEGFGVGVQSEPGAGAVFRLILPIEPY